MRKNKRSCSISEFCRNNNFRTLEFYKMPRRHPELARKMKANFAGERVLDEEAMRTARAILRKEKIEDRRKRSAADAANEINTLAAQIEELRKEVGRTRFFRWLKRMGVLMSNNLPYQQYIDRGYFAVKESVFEVDGLKKTYQQTLVTGKGQVFIIGLLKKYYGKECLQ